MTVTVPTTEVFYSSAVYTTNTQFWNAHQYSSDNRPPPIVYPTPSPAPTTTSNPTPSYLAQYLPSRLTSACSCLTFPIPTVTKAGTQTVTVARTTSVTSHSPRSQQSPSYLRLSFSPLTSELTPSKTVPHRNRHLLRPNNRHLRRSMRPLRNHQPAIPDRDPHPHRPHRPPHPRPRPKNHLLPALRRSPELHLLELQPRGPVPPRLRHRQRRPAGDPLRAGARYVPQRRGARRLRGQGGGGCDRCLCAGFVCRGAVRGVSE